MMVEGKGGRRMFGLGGMGKVIVPEVGREPRILLPIQRPAVTLTGC